MLDSIPDEVTTPSWRALADVARSEALKRAGRDHEALAELKAALEEDPEFTLASARSGRYPVCSLGQQREGLQMYAAAIQSLARRRITAREEMRVRGLVAVDSGDMGEADRQFGHWATMCPNDPRPLRYRYFPLLMMGRGPEAIECLRKAIAMNYRPPIVLGALAICHYFLGQRGEAEEAIAEVRRTGDQDRANGLEGELLASSAELDSARHFFKLLQVSQEPSDQLRVFLSDVLVLCEMDNLHAAIDVADRLLSSNRDNVMGSSVAQLHVVRAWLACKVADFAAARHQRFHVSLSRSWPGDLIDGH